MNNEKTGPSVPISVTQHVNQPFAFSPGVRQRSHSIVIATLMAGDDWTYNDNGVKQDYTCIPQRPEPFKYSTLKKYDAQGNLAKPVTVEEMRKMAEMYHRIKVEL